MSSSCLKMNLCSVFVFAFFLAEGWTARNIHGLCPQIVVPNGKIRYRQRGKIARFMCNTGYMRAGDRISVCVRGKWDHVISKCVRASCKNAIPPTNGFIHPSYGGAVLNFYCKSGYYLRGANITYCDGVNWDNPLPSCLPPSFKKCNRRNPDFNDCLSFAIFHAIKSLDTSFPEHGLPNLNPFEAPANVVLRTGDSTNGIRQVFDDIRIYGYTKITNVQASFDLDKHVLSLRLIFPEVLVESDMHVNGVLMFLPIENRGTLSVLYKKAIFEMDFYLEEYEKEGVRYYRLLKTNFDFNSEQVILEIRDIFDDESLNKAFNKELKAKERGVFEYLRKTYSNIIGEMYGDLFNNLLMKVPIADLFDG